MDGPASLPRIWKIHISVIICTSKTPSGAMLRAYWTVIICERLQEKGPCAAKNYFSVNAGFRKYDAIAISIENLTLIGRVVCEI